MVALFLSCFNGNSSLAWPVESCSKSCDVKLFVAADRSAELALWKCQVITLDIPSPFQ